jgi:hypothetical protein
MRDSGCPFGDKHVDRRLDQPPTCLDLSRAKRVERGRAGLNVPSGFLQLVESNGSMQQFGDCPGLQHQRMQKDAETDDDVDRGARPER